MNLIYVILIVLFSLILLIFLIAYICFRLTFFVTKKEKQIKENDLPKGEIYLPFYPQMQTWANELKQTPCKEITIKSFDGLTLYGKYYEYSKNSPIEIMFHGYRGTAERDLCGGVQRCFALGRSAIVVDQRGHGRSGGNTISFGVLERKDCLFWTKYASEQFPNRSLFITGISMGASTVMMASCMDLPDSVVGAIADCGYSSQKEIIKKTIKKMKLPPSIFYPFVKFGARIYGKFNLEEAAPIDSVKRSKIPIFFAHGDNDDFVPCEMSKACYNACNTPKSLLIVKGAGHGLAYLVDNDGYVKQLKEFEKNINI